MDFGSNSILIKLNMDIDLNAPKFEILKSQRDNDINLLQYQKEQQALEILRLKSDLFKSEDEKKKIQKKIRDYDKQLSELKTSHDLFVQKLFHQLNCVSETEVFSSIDELQEKSYEIDEIRKQLQAAQLQLSFEASKNDRTDTISLLQKENSKLNQELLNIKSQSLSMELRIKQMEPKILELKDQKYKLIEENEKNKVEAINAKEAQKSYEDENSSLIQQLTEIKLLLSQSQIESSRQKRILSFASKRLNPFLMKINSSSPHFPFFTSIKSLFDNLIQMDPSSPILIENLSDIESNAIEIDRFFEKELNEIQYNPELQQKFLQKSHQQQIIILQDTINNLQKENEDIKKQLNSKTLSSQSDQFDEMNYILKKNKELEKEVETLRNKISLLSQNSQLSNLKYEL